VSQKVKKLGRGNIWGNSLQTSRPLTKGLRKNTAAKLRSWRVSIIRKRGQYLGTLEAPNEKSAAAALAEFDLNDEQRRRLVVQKRA